MVMQAIRCRRRIPERALKSAHALLTQPHTQIQGRVRLEKGRLLAIPTKILYSAACPWGLSSQRAWSRNSSSYWGYGTSETGMLPALVSLVWGGVLYIHEQEFPKMTSDKKEIIRVLLGNNNGRAYCNLGGQGKPL